MINLLRYGGGGMGRGMEKNEQDYYFYDKIAKLHKHSFLKILRQNVKIVLIFQCVST